MTSGEIGLSTRPRKPKEYVGIRPSEEGVVFEAGAQSFTLSGGRTYPVVERVLRAWRAGHSMRDLRDRMPDPVRLLAERIVEALDARNLLVDVGPAPKRSAFQAFIEDRLGVDQSVAPLDRWQRAVALCIGRGTALQAAAKELAASGCAEVRIILTGHPGVAERTLSDIRATDLVVFASDEPRDLNLALEVAEWARAHGRPCSICVPMQGLAVIAPPIEPAFPGVEDLVQWLAGPTELQQPSLACLELMGCIAAHNALCTAFGIDVPRRRGHVQIVRADFEVERHALVPAPTPAGEARELSDFTHLTGLETSALEDAPAYERVRASLEPWFDPLLGCFRSLTGRDLPQVPLYHEAIEVRSAGEDAYNHLVASWGMDAREAGLKAMKQAVVRLACSAAAAQRSIVAEYDEQAWRAEAFAKAVVVSPRFETARLWADIEPAQIEHEPSQCLLRLLARLTPDSPTLHLHWLPGGGAAVAEVSLGGVPRAAATGPSAEAAIYEALGRACAELRVAPLLGPGRFCNYTGGLIRPPSLKAGDWRQALAAPGGPPSSGVTYRRIQSLGLPATIHIGFAELDEFPW